MISEAAQGFDKLFDAVHRSDTLATTPRRRLEAELIYFLTQAKLPLKQRDSSHNIKARWIEFNKITASAPLFAPFRRDSAFWGSLEAFACGAEAGPLKEDQNRREGSTVPVEPPRTDPVDFFRKLLSDVINRPTMSEAEKLAIVSSIRYLVVEGERARGLRDHKAIKVTWDRLYPLPEKFRFLELYKDDLTLKAQISFFVRNGFF